MYKFTTTSEHKHPEVSNYSAPIKQDLTQVPVETYQLNPRKG